MGNSYNDKVECECGVTVSIVQCSVLTTSLYVCLPQVEDCDCIACESGCKRWYHTWYVYFGACYVQMFRAEHNLSGAWDFTLPQVKTSRHNSLASIAACTPTAIGT